MQLFSHSTFPSPSVSEKAQKKNKIIWLSLMCFDFPISNPVILPHIGMNIISVFHLHKFGLWTTRISIRLASTAVPANYEVFGGSVVAVKTGCFSFVQHKHINSVNSGCSFDSHIQYLLPAIPILWFDAVSSLSDTFKPTTSFYSSSTISIKNSVFIVLLVFMPPH